VNLSVVKCQSTDSTTMRPTTTMSTYTWSPQSEYDCNFETGFCKWQNDSNSDFPWKRTNFPSFTSSTGPNTDHTYLNRSGYFIFTDVFLIILPSLSWLINFKFYLNKIKSRYPQKNNQKCRIQSPVIQPADQCLEFYYHAYGSDVNALNIYLKQQNQLGAPVWSRTRNQGNRWLRGEIRIKNVQNPYQIVFEGVVGGIYGVS